MHLEPDEPGFRLDTANIDEPASSSARLTEPTPKLLPALETLASKAANDACPTTARLRTIAIGQSSQRSERTARGVGGNRVLLGSATGPPPPPGARGGPGAARAGGGRAA